MVSFPILRGSSKQEIVQTWSLHCMVQLKISAPFSFVCMASLTISASSQLMLSFITTRAVGKLQRSGQFMSNGLLLSNHAFNCWSVWLSFLILLSDISACCTDVLCFDLVRSVIALCMPDMR